MEVVKLFHAMLIDSDLEMYDEVSNTPAKARTSNLSEELGQVENISCCLISISFLVVFLTFIFCSLLIQLIRSSTSSVIRQGLSRAIKWNFSSVLLVVKTSRMFALLFFCFFIDSFLFE
jgi:hypothetical protein